MFSCGVLCFVFCVCVCVLSVVALCYRAFLSGFLSGIVRALSFSFSFFCLRLSYLWIRLPESHPITLSPCHTALCHPLFLSVTHWATQWAIVANCESLWPDCGVLWPDCGLLCSPVFSFAFVPLCQAIPYVIGRSPRQVSTPEHNPPGSCPPEDAVRQEGLPHK